MSSNSEARKRAEEKKTKQPEQVVEMLATMERSDLEKITVLVLRVLSEVKSYSLNMVELAPYAHNADSDPYSTGFSEGRRRQAANTLGLIGEILESIRRQVDNAQV